MDRLSPDQSLPAGSELNSPNGQHRLVMQTDGNLVLYRANGAAKWASGTDGRSIAAAIMQGDGNLVMYDPNGAVWASGTDGNPGAVLVMQDDGNLVIYTAAGQAIWATGTNITAMRVTGFLPSRNGFHFANSFPHVPDYQINIAGMNIAIGDASNGLCGGMVFATRDLFESNRAPPQDTTGPASGALFNFMAQRLMDSFELPGGPLHYYALMSPALPDHETWFSQVGLAPHGRAWSTIREEWPKLRAGLDAGHPMPMALILVKSADPAVMGHNHQVLAWGYDLDGDDLAIRIYDPNFPDNNTRRVELNIGNPLNTTAMQHTGGAAGSGGTPVFAFFSQTYSFVSPPDLQAPPPPERRFTIQNATAAVQTVRVFNPGDLIQLAPLPAGEFTLGPHGRDTWLFHNGLAQARVTANGRPLGLANPGDTLIITQDDRLMIRNVTDTPQHIRIYKADDRLRWVTLPNGDQSLAPHEDLCYVIPSDVSSVAVVINGQTFVAGLGEVIVFQG